MELMDLNRLLAENSYPGRGIVIGPVSYTHLFLLIWKGWD